jgi:hypothetical protein
MSNQQSAATPPLPSEIYEDQWSSEEHMNLVTAGQYKTEKEAAAAFDNAVEIGKRLGIFHHVYSEVEGSYILPPPESDDKTPRIDRILSPGPTLESAGWRHGLMGVELKKSGEKIGPFVNQCLDYSNALFWLRGTQVRLQWIFLFPCPKPHGNIESIMQQRRVGAAAIRRMNYWSIRFGLNAFGFEYSQDALLHCKSAVAGKRVGSR